MMCSDACNCMFCNCCCCNNTDRFDCVHTEASKHEEKEIGRIVDAECGACCLLCLLVVYR